MFVFGCVYRKEGVRKAWMRTQLMQWSAPGGGPPGLHVGCKGLGGNP